jgi:protein-S-isoprenylcysteine O-methyltransferase Ste14
MTGRILAFLYGTIAYAIFFATFLYAIGFVGNLGVPKSMDSPAEGPWQTALLIDAALLALFALQHSIMARPAFKRVLTSVVSPVVERSTYVLASSLALIVLFWQWRPLGGIVERRERHRRGVTLCGLRLRLGTLCFVTTFVINHFDLFGLVASLAPCARPATTGAQVRDSRAVSDGAASAVRGLVLRVLVHADDDGHAFVLRDHDDGLHSHRDPARGARSHARASGVRGLSRARADADSVPAPSQ